MKFSEQLWQDNKPLYQKMYQHPFNQKLADGTLELDIFKRYLIQDAQYLVAYGKALALASTKAWTTADMLQCLSQAHVAVVFEKSLHDDFMTRFNITEQQPQSTACHHYCNFILATAWSESYPVILATLLPCFWVYASLGQAFNITEKHPYQVWIETYTDPEFITAVNAMKTALDTVATQSDARTKQRMQEHFTWAMQLELNFWESAYSNSQ